MATKKTDDFSFLLSELKDQTVNKLSDEKVNFVSIEPVKAIIAAATDAADLTAEAMKNKHQRMYMARVRKARLFLIQAQKCLNV